MRVALDRQVAGRRHLALAVIVLHLVGGPAGQALGISVEIGANFRTTTTPESGFIPPDTMGAVGPGHVMLLVNGRYELYTKNPAVTGAQDDGTPIAGHASNLNGFWANTVGIPNTVPNTFDPRVTYDPFAQRWYAAAVDGARSPDSSYLLAVSDSDDPTDGWTGFRIDVDPTNTRWGDFPMLGFDGSYVYLSGNDFPIVGGGTQYPVRAFPKADLLGVTPSIANVQRLNLDGATNQVTVALDNLGPDTQPYHLWEEGASLAEYNALTEVAGTLVNSVGTVAVGAFFGGPTDARQPDPVPLALDVDNDRINSRTVRINNSYWMTYPRKVGADDVLRWVEVDATTLLMKQNGLVIMPGQDMYYPSIAVNADGDVVIGYSSSGPGAGQYPSAYAVVGETNAGVTTFGSPLLLKQGVDSYFEDFGTNRNRWGDYSNTVPDPADPNIFWAFQEWASAPAIYGNEPNPRDTWSINASEIITYDTGELYWAQAVGGAYASGASWLGGAAPIATDHLIFSRTGSPFTVTLAAPATADRASVRQGDVTWDLSGQTLALTEASDPALLLAEFQGIAALTMTGGGAVTAANVQVGTAESRSASLTVGGGSTLTVSQALTLASAGALNLDGGTIEVDALDISAGQFNWTTGTLRLTSGAYAVGAAGSLGDNVALDSGQTLDVVGTATLEAGSTLSINSGAAMLVSSTLLYDPTAALNLAGGELTVPSIQPLSGSPPLNLNFTAGTLRVTFDDVVIEPGQPLGDNLAIGSNRVLEVSNSLFVGQSGIGMLSISGSGQVSATATVLGRFVGSIGAATISGAGAGFDYGTQILVGRDGDGELTIETGAQVSGALAIIGDMSTGVGQAIVRDAGSMWTINDSLFVGNGGEGLLDIQSGALVDASHIRLGMSTAAMGFADVSGAGSALSTGGSLLVGEAGTGQLSVSNGGAVASATAALGDLATASGVASINGAGSIWNVTGLIEVGGEGDGDLTISGGGALNSASAVIGDGAGSTSVATVTGAGSNWTNSGNLAVGDAGGGVLNIQSDGEVVVNGTLSASATGTLNLSGGKLRAATLDTATGAFNLIGGRLVADAVSADLDIQGATLAPGDSPGTTGVVGAYTQGAGSTLEIEIGGLTPGTGHDELLVGGTADLAGTLDLLLFGGFTPAAGQAFDVLVAGGLAGTFDTVNGTFLGNGLFFDVNYSATTVTAQVIFQVLFGDANNDGVVDSDDLIAVQAGFGQQGAADGLLLGDANDDGAVTADDLVAVQQNFGNALGPGGGGAAGAPVPEPGVGALLLATFLLRRGWRRGGGPWDHGTMGR